MKSRQLRIALTVRGETDEVLRELSVLLNKPKTAIITEIVQDTLPALKKVIQAIKQVKTGQEQVALQTVQGFLIDAANTMAQTNIYFEELRKNYAGNPK